MDIEKTMQFMLDMQAKHEVWLQKHDEAFTRIEAAIEANTTRIAQLVDVSLSLVHTVEETNASVRELREAQAATDYKLNALIDTVDKLVRRNGKHE